MKGNGKHFFLAKGQTPHVLLQEFFRKGKIWPRACNLEFDGCHNLLCQREESVLVEVAAEKELKVVLRLWVAKKSSSEVEECYWIPPDCNRYKPSFSCPTPIVLQQVKSWMKQKVERKIRQQG